MNDWQPSISPLIAQKRAILLQQIRQFFADRQVMEVETPLLAHAPVTDPYLQALLVQDQYHTRYLQTSPEYAMKRMLAAGFGDIYQLCKAFRQEESGRLHHIEFTMLEWYRLGFDHHDLMTELDQLLQQILLTKPADRVSYAECFKNSFAINPHYIQLSELRDLTHRTIGQIAGLDNPDHDSCLQLLFSEGIEPYLGKEQPIFVYDYPASQAALAKMHCINGIQVAARFELFYQGIELANGYHELTDATEQSKRFEQDLKTRQTLNRENVPIDNTLLSAMAAGLPECAGVALGVDRLLMLLCQQNEIKAVAMQ